MAEVGLELSDDQKMPAPNHYRIFGFFGCAAEHAGILVPRPGIEPGPPAVEVRSHNHWVAREVPAYLLILEELLYRSHLFTPSLFHSFLIRHLFLAKQCQVLGTQLWTKQAEVDNG